MVTNPITATPRIVLAVHLGAGDIEAVARAAKDALDDTPLFLEGAGRQGQMKFKAIYEHGLELGVPRGSWERYDVADIIHAGQVHYHALKPEAESGVGTGAPSSAVEIPGKRLFVDPHLRRCGVRENPGVLHAGCRR